MLHQRFLRSLGYFLPLFAALGLQAQSWNYQHYLPAPPWTNQTVQVLADPRQHQSTVAPGQHMLPVGIPQAYYDACIGLGGQQLRQALHQTIRTGARALDYTPDVWQICRAADQSPTDTNAVWLIYLETNRLKTLQDNGSGQSQVWNREHVWAKSHGDFGTTPGPGTDGHHLRAADRDENTRRGYLNFGEVAGPRTLNSQYYEPPNSAKGDIARMIFYMDLRWEGGDGYPDLVAIDGTGTGNNAPTHGDKAALLRWHDQDPVDAYELRRNHLVYGLQGNRNPFVDHPELVHLLYGTDQQLVWDGGALAANTPILGIPASLPHFGVVPVGQASAPSSYTLSAMRLTADLLVEASTGFEISLQTDSASFGPQLRLVPVQGTIAPTTLYVRFRPTDQQQGDVEGHLLHTSGTLQRSLALQATQGQPDNLWTRLYTADFEQNCAAGWQRLSTTGQAQWQCIRVASQAGADSVGRMQVVGTGADSVQAWLISPFFDLAGYQRAELGLWAQQPSGGRTQWYYSFDYAGSGPPHTAAWFRLGEADAHSEGQRYCIDLQSHLANHCSFALVHTASPGAATRAQVDSIELRVAGQQQPAAQRIYFASIADQLPTTLPIGLHAVASSGLPVQVECLAGPARVQGNELWLDGPAGEVRLRATQAGNSRFLAADAVEQSFEVLRPLALQQPSVPGWRIVAEGARRRISVLQLTDPRGHYIELIAPDGRVLLRSPAAQLPIQLPESLPTGLYWARVVGPTGRQTLLFWLP